MTMWTDGDVWGAPGSRSRLKERTVNGKHLEVVMTTLDACGGSCSLGRRTVHHITREELIADAQSLCGEISRQDINVESYGSWHSFLKSKGAG